MCSKQILGCPQAKGSLLRLPAGEDQVTTGRRVGARVFGNQRFQGARRSAGGGQTGGQCVHTTDRANGDGITHVGDGDSVCIICVPPGEIAPMRLADVEVGYQGVMMVVGSLAVLLSSLTSPPPKTVAVLVTLAGALVATLTVRVMGG